MKFIIEDNNLEDVHMQTYTVDEVAQICQCHSQTIREHIKKGRLRACRPGRAYCIKQSDLDDFMRQLENAQLQASLERKSEKKCHCINEKAVSGTTILHSQTVKELEAVLEPKTKGRPNSCMTN
ncbi:helix-turn-helix domain-containing protein [Snodgrassella gandavensis]|uniref:helix-turn-helix domain-containing protein n=1 Tax=Snodgrassella gandavensis TaxID=2946698 RepID=UPI001EF3F25D|nr:helix-turn-helix domain-containing protein [Snodgrassella gandavensis]